MSSEFQLRHLQSCWSLSEETVDKGRGCQWLDGREEVFCGEAGRHSSEVEYSLYCDKGKSGTGGGKVLRILSRSGECVRVSLRVKIKTCICLGWIWALLGTGDLVFTY